MWGARHHLFGSLTARSQPSADRLICAQSRRPVGPYAQAQVPIPTGIPIRYQAMKNSVQTIASAMKNGIISAITVPIPDRLS